MRFTEQETVTLIDALSARARACAKFEEKNTLRQRYPGQTPETRALCARMVDNYRAEREAIEALIARFEYVGCGS